MLLFIAFLDLRCSMECTPEFRRGIKCLKFQICPFMGCWIYLFFFFYYNCKMCCQANLALVEEERFYLSNNVCRYCKAKGRWVRARRERRRGRSLDGKRRNITEWLWQQKRRKKMYNVGSCRGNLLSAVVQALYWIPLPVLSSWLLYLICLFARAQLTASLRPLSVL